MVSLFVPSPADSGFEPQPGQTKDYNFVLDVSLLNTQHYGEGTNTDRL